MDTPHASEPLFEVPLGPEEGVGVPRAKVDKTFRAYDQHQLYLLPPSIDDWVPEGHLARFVSELVEEVLDLEPFLASYTEVRGYPPYDPRLMVKLLVYGYLVGVRSSRAVSYTHLDVYKRQASRWPCSTGRRHRSRLLRRGSGRPG